MFKQKRVGINNKEFKCIKYRSMRLDAEVGKKREMNSMS